MTPPTFDLSTFDLNEMSNHFKQAGFFVRGIKPGKKTVEFLQFHLVRITFVGAIFLAVQFVQAAAGVLLCRESPRHLMIVPIYRLIAEPLRAYLLYKSALTALRGTRSSWHKMARTGTAQVREPTSAEVHS